MPKRPRPRLQRGIGRQHDRKESRDGRQVGSVLREGMVGAESYFCLTVLHGAMAATFCAELLVGAPRSPDPPSRTPSFFRGAASSCG